MFCKYRSAPQLLFDKPRNGNLEGYSLVRQISVGIHFCSANTSLTVSAWVSKSFWHVLWFFQRPTEDNGSGGEAVYWVHLT